MAVAIRRTHDLKERSRNQCSRISTPAGFRCRNFRGKQSVKVAGVNARRFEIVIAQDAAKESEVRPDAANHVLIERAQQPCNRRLARRREGNQLREHGIVIERHHPAFVNARVLANPRPSGLQQSRDLAGRREEAVVRIFSVDAALYRMATEPNVFVR